MTELASMFFERRKRKIYEFMVDRGFSDDPIAAAQDYADLPEEEKQSLNRAFDAHLKDLDEKKARKELDEKEAQKALEEKEREDDFESSLPNVFKGACIDDFIGTSFEKYSRHILETGRNCFLLGQTGIGKTRFAYALSRAWMRKNESYKTVEAVELLSSCKAESFAGNDVCGYLRSNYGQKHLVIDEIDKMRGTDFDFTYFSYLINWRYAKGLQTVVLGQKDSRKPEEVVGAANFSRLVGDGGKGAVLKGEDRRRF